MHDEQTGVLIKEAECEFARKTMFAIIHLLPNNHKTYFNLINEHSVKIFVQLNKTNS